MIESFRLPFTFDVPKLREDLHTLGAHAWHAHYNTSDYEGQWFAAALRAPDGNDRIILPDGNEFRDTPLMERCPYIAEVLRSFHCRLMSVRFLAIKGRTTIKEHIDRGLSIESGEVRLHIPVETSPDIIFMSNGKRVVMYEGECWYLNAELPHSIVNPGDRDRVHLVIDCEVNPWLASFFPAFTFDDEKKKRGLSSLKTQADLEQMKTYLRELNTPTALTLISELQLHMVENDADH